MTNDDRLAPLPLFALFLIVIAGPTLMASFPDFPPVAWTFDMFRTVWDTVALFWR